MAVKKYKERFKVLKRKTILLHKDIARMPAVIDDLTGQVDYPKEWGMKKKAAEKSIRQYRLIHSMK